MWSQCKYIRGLRLWQEVVVRLRFLKQGTEPAERLLWPGPSLCLLFGLCVKLLLRLIVRVVKLLGAMCRVGIQVPTIEIRYENLTVDAKCVVGDRALPTLKNVTINTVVVYIDTPILISVTTSFLNAQFKSATISSSFSSCNDHSGRVHGRHDF